MVLYLARGERDYKSFSQSLPTNNGPQQTTHDVPNVDHEKEWPA